MRFFEELKEIDRLLEIANRKDDTMIIEPTVGRVVWYMAPMIMAPGQPHELAAIVTHVHDTRMVNLTVFKPNGETMAATSVPLCQPGDDANHDNPYCEWMPYQLGQAAKPEEAEAAAQERSS